MSRIETVDYEYNTIYTTNYDDNKFNDNLLGKTKTEILTTLGEPFNKTKLDFYNAIVYTDKKDSLYLINNCDCLGLLGTNVKYIFISFNSNLDVETVMISGYDINQDSIKRLNKKSILENLGSPARETICDCNCEVWSYSKIRNGSYSGKEPNIYIRNILFNENEKVGKIIKTKGSTFDKYIETCEKKEK